MAETPQAQPEAPKPAAPKPQAAPAAAKAPEGQTLFHWLLSLKEQADAKIVEIGQTTRTKLHKFLRFEVSDQLEDKGAVKNVATSVGHAVDGIGVGAIRTELPAIEHAIEGAYATYETSHLWRIFTDPKRWFKSAARMATSLAQTTITAFTETFIEYPHQIADRSIDKSLHQTNQSVEKTGIGKIWTIPTNLASRGLSKVTGAFKWLKDQARRPLNYIHEAIA